MVGLLMTYYDYVMGLQLLEGDRVPAHRLEYERAASVLNSLQGAAQCAGYNTWQAARDRFTRAQAVFTSWPKPCRATIDHIEEPCPRMAADGEDVCHQCRARILTAMSRACYTTGYAAPHEAPEVKDDHEH